MSMDGRGRCLDNIFIERLWRSLKYEEVYLKDYRLVPEARTGIGGWFQFYNHERPHQGLGYRTPANVIWAGEAMRAALLVRGAENLEKHGKTGMAAACAAGGRYGLVIDQDNQSRRPGLDINLLRLKIGLDNGVHFPGAPRKWLDME